MWDSFYTEERECFACRAVLAGGVQVFSELGGGSFYAQGPGLERRGEASLAFYVCTKDLEAGSFVDGLNLPENYPDNFLRAERTEGFGGVQPVNGFPDDVCGNRLVVSSYKHDLLLRYWKSVDEGTGAVLASGWHDTSAVKVDFTGRRSFVDWS